MKKSFDVIDLLAEISYFALLWEAFDQEIRIIKLSIVLKTLMNFRSLFICLLPPVLSLK